MKRTRKWSYVEQEAKRLAGLGLTPIEIATRIGVNRSTIQRWMACGKLEKRVKSRVVANGQTPTQWAATVRKDYALDATDEQLVRLAEAALGMSLDPALSPNERMTATARFQGIVKQLALVARLADADTGQAKPEAKREVSRRADPRGLLMAVK